MYIIMVYYNGPLLNLCPLKLFFYGLFTLKTIQKWTNHVYISSAVCKELLINCQNHST